MSNKMRPTYLTLAILALLATAAHAELLIGTATTSITPPLPVAVSGQFASGLPRRSSRPSRPTSSRWNHATARSRKTLRFSSRATWSTSQVTSAAGFEPPFTSSCRISTRPRSCSTQLTRTQRRLRRRANTSFRRGLRRRPTALHFWSKRLPTQFNRLGMVASREPCRGG